ncbi:MAG TPA: hypothetical protein VGV10_04970 [Thermoleophilaceae bacterium]|nr:hypothetical protein [Thermoleophilaceae bacterium]
MSRFVPIGVSVSSDSAGKARRMVPHRASRVVWLLAGLALVFSVLAGPAQARQSTKKAIWGPTRIDGVSQFPLYRDLGAGVYQGGLHWSSVARRRPANPRDPRDPAYAWPSDLAYAVSQARRYGMKVSLLIIGAPRWSNGNRPFNYSPRRLGDFADFAAAAARRYPTVNLWQIWGEPSRAPNWRPMIRARSGRKLTARQAAAPRRYARMLDASYAALKGVRRSNRVIGGMTFTTGDILTRQWIENMRLPNGKPPRMDMYGHNPFSFRPPDLRQKPQRAGWIDMSDLDDLTALVDRNLKRSRRQRIPLYLSEFTISTAPDSEFGSFSVTPATQARWIRSALRITRRMSRIYTLGWVHVRDIAGVTSGGLIYSSGERKPGYFAFRAG